MTAAPHPAQPPEETAPEHPPIEWRISDEPVPYPDAVAEMEARAAAIREGTAPELVWLLEHPPLYTAGTSARPADLLEPERFPTYQSGRGGQYTYHGPGQRVAYVMIDLKRPRPGLEGPDIRAYVNRLEEWLIQTLAQFNVKGERRDGRVGIWVDQGAVWGHQGPGGQDRGTGRAGAPLGDAPRRRPQRRSGPQPFRGDRALRHQRTRRHQPARAGTPRHAAGSRSGAPGSVGRRLRGVTAPRYRSVQTAGQSRNGSVTRMVSSRSGLVETIATGASISSSMRRMYFTAVAGRSAQLRAPWVLSFQPGIVS